jgi:anti-sigma B factor antagonist
MLALRTAAERRLHPAMPASRRATYGLPSCVAHHRAIPRSAAAAVRTKALVVLMIGWRMPDRRCADMGRLLRPYVITGVPARRVPVRRGLSIEILSCTSYDLDDCTVVAVTGEIDSSSAHQLRDALRTVAGARSRIIIDMTGVTFTDSTGLGVLLGAQRRARASDGWVRLVCTHRAVLKVLRITHLDSIFPIHDTVDDARVGAGKPPPPRLLPQQESTMRPD